MTIGVCDPMFFGNFLSFWNFLSAPEFVGLIRQYYKKLCSLNSAIKDMDACIIILNLLHAKKWQTVLNIIVK